VGERVASGRYDALPIANLPRSVFLNRDSLPFVWRRNEQTLLYRLPPRLSKQRT
jgi:hypothetical protein